MSINPDMFPNITYLIGAYIIENGIEEETEGFVIAEGKDAARKAQAELNQLLQLDYNEEDFIEYLRDCNCDYTLDENGNRVDTASGRTTLLYLLKVLSEYT